MSQKRFLLAALLFGCLPALFAFAQDDPFGDGDSAPAEEAAGEEPGADDPFAAGESPAAATPRGKPSAPVEPAVAETDPIVLAVRRSPPKTPAELIRAVRILVRAGRQDVAATYLQQLLADAPNERILAGLHGEAGSGFFMALAADPKLQPAGREVSQAVMAAAERQTKNPARLEAAIAAFASDNSAARAKALAELQRAGAAAVAPIVRALAKADPKSRQAQYMKAAIAGLGAEAIEPLLGSLPAVETPHSAVVAELLGVLRASRARDYLIRPYLAPQSSPELRLAAETALLRIGASLPDEESGGRILKKRAKEFLAGQPVLRADADDRVVLWRWNAASQASEPVKLLSSDASLQVACRLAYDLYSLRPNDPDSQRLYLATQLEAAKIVGGLDRPLADGPGSTRELATRFSLSLLEAIFQESLESKHIAAAIAAIEVLGDVGGEAALHPASGDESVFIKALKSPYRRLQLAAAEAIEKIDPQSPYAGSSYYSRALGRLVRTAGQRRVLIGLPNDNEAHTLAGLLLEMGYESDVGLTGAETFKRATDPEKDYEFVLLHDAIDHPAALELLQWLRRDPRTAHLPVALIARDHRLEEMQEIAGIDRLTLAFPRVHDAARAGYLIDRLIGLMGRDYVTFEERQRAGAWALAALSRMAAAPERYAFYDLVREQDALETALFAPETAPIAVAALGSLATPEAQRMLLASASDTARPIDQRKAAAAAFEAAIKHRGILLTLDEIWEQIDRASDAHREDLATQEVLASLIVAIEAPSRAEAAEAAKARPTIRPLVTPPENIPPASTSSSPVN